MGGKHSETCLSEQSLFCRHTVTFTAVYFVLSHFPQIIQGGAQLSLASMIADIKPNVSLILILLYFFQFLEAFKQLYLQVVIFHQFLSLNNFKILFFSHSRKLPTLFLSLFSMCHIFTSLLDLYQINPRALQLFFTYLFPHFFSFYHFVP